MAKKKTNEEKIVVALDTLDKQIRSLQKYGASFDKYIDDAGMHNNKQRVTQLIKQKMGVYALCDQLSMLKSNFMLGVSSAQVMSGLSTLPAALAGCKGLLNQAPDFSKMGKNIEKIFKDIQGTTDEIAKLNGILDKAVTPKDNSSLSSILDGTSDMEESDQFKAEYAAMMERIRGQVASDPVTKAASATENNITGDIDIAGIIADENRKN